jgi:hypothetical protein
VYCVAILDLRLAGGEGVWILEHTAGVNEAYAVGGYICEFGSGELILYVFDSGRGGEGEAVEVLVVGGFHVESDMSLSALRCI